MKLVTEAIFSHLSDHIPAINPIAPIEKEDRNKKTAKYRAFSRRIPIKILNTKIDKKLIITDLVIEAKITANVTSSAESGLPTKSTIFPIIFPDSIEDDECAKDCWIICILINPGAKNSIKGTPRTTPLFSPIAREMTNKTKLQ